MTLKLAADNKMHFYKTGTTIDMVPPYAASLVTGFIVTGRGSSDVLIVDSMSAGASSIAIDHATLSILRDNAISAGTNVTVSGGILNFNGFADAIGNLTLTAGSQAFVGTINNNATITVSSSTLSAVSIICDTLIIGAPSAAVAANAENAAATSDAVAAQTVSETTAAAIEDAVASVAEQPAADAANPAAVEETSSSSVLPAVDAPQSALAAMPTDIRTDTAPEFVTAAVLPQRNGTAKERSDIDSTASRKAFLKIVQPRPLRGCGN